MCLISPPLPLAIGPGQNGAIQLNRNMNMERESKMRTMQDICSKETEHWGIKMTMIGYWQDLQAYYAGSDGNVYSFSNGAGYGGNWSNCGPIDEFRSALLSGKRFRGQLI